MWKEEDAMSSDYRIKILKQRIADILDAKRNLEAWLQQDVTNADALMKATQALDRAAVHVQTAEDYRVTGARDLIQARLVLVDEELQNAAGLIKSVLGECETEMA
jgi:ABC-type sugar transport system ATPase subunit